MNFSEIKTMVSTEYDHRNLASDVRYKALDHFEDFLKSQLVQLWNDVSKFPKNPSHMKLLYTKYNGKDLSGAKSSVVNEVYNQLAHAGITLTEYTE